jgi:integrase
MHRDSNRLTALKVAKVNEPGRYGDGGGLVLQVSKWGTKAWLFRYEREGRERQMGLGPLGTISLAEARGRAAEARKLLLDGLDPLAVRQDRRQAAQLAAARRTTFRDCAEKYVTAQEAGWRNEKHRAQWRATLARYAYPVIGELPVASVDTSLIIKILEPIWTIKTETASRLRGRIEKVLDWAKVRGFRQGENPARWQGHLDHLLPKKTKIAAVKHHPALPYSEIPAFMAELRARDGISARALEYAILTAARTGAVIGALWTEVDLASKVWTVPPQRAGTKITGEDPKPRRVPLSDRALEILRSVPRENGNLHVFIGGKAGEPLSNMAMLELMREMRPGFVPHGFRSTFKDWCSETTNYPNEVSEAALWHVVADDVEAAYRRGDLFEKHRRLMNDWARYCNQPAKQSSNIRVFKSERPQLEPAGTGFGE